MNCRGGIFAIIIGGMAVALFGLAVFSTQAVLFEEQSDDYIAVMSDVRMVWQNLVLLFDAAFEDAVVTRTCAALDQTTLETGYLNRVLNSVNGGLPPGVGSCSYDITSVLDISDPAVFTAKISCWRNVTVGGTLEFRAEYTKEVTYQKSCP